ncbi:hypothetical protein [Paraburkholderia phenazinium]|uniref:hypothetical protein n=1 Tax=Paraburkholderia phenazinium TaxID=60549 RepID=UPI001FD1DB33|nr:hypothetical protein [Paraburkholderia phenazinium]
MLRKPCEQNAPHCVDCTAFTRQRAERSLDVLGCRDKGIKATVVEALTIERHERCDQFRQPKPAAIQQPVRLSQGVNHSRLTVRTRRLHTRDADVGVHCELDGITQVQHRTRAMALSIKQMFPFGGGPEPAKVDRTRSYERGDIATMREGESILVESGLFAFWTHKESCFRRRKQNRKP